MRSNVFNLLEDCVPCMSQNALVRSDEIFYKCFFVILSNVWNEVSKIIDDSIVNHNNVSSPLSFSMM